jgi:putative heme-binding domain-containing protein
MISFPRILVGGALLAATVLRVSCAEPPASPGPLSPSEALRQFQVADDLEVELVLSEPEISQPVFLNFDERGRMWVVEFRQYPQPAGLRVVSRDDFWRAVYDRVPEAPPRHVRGADRITIHEDTDGDGTFDRHKTFLEGLNIVTAVERGRGGVWVLHPPYLLFYPDADGDDTPDADPTVHLAGFGIEDTHSVANSLRWGPDGWLYGAQGSTVTGHMLRPGLDREPFLHTLGQGIWRYHPESRRFEFFAEGGGNTFGVEIDAKGRIFSGHNGGDTRGFHYVQGGYLRKGFEKHGPLSNPYAFGFFEPIAHHKTERFTHNFVICEGGALPAEYTGRLLGIEPLQGRVVLSDIAPEGSTFRTRDRSRPLTSRDPWFRPVDIKAGPDGAIYLCDWYDNQIAHYRAADGAMEKALGRIYRLKSKGAAPARAFDLGKLTSPELSEVLRSENKWFRQTALRLLADRRDASLIPRLSEVLSREDGQLALESLWALHACGGLDEAHALRALGHADAQVRLWTVRLLCDAGSASPAAIERLVTLARDEPDVEARLQLAASARRLPAGEGLRVVRELLMRDEDASDPRQPLMLWWAIEAKAAGDREAVLALLADSQMWERPIVRDHLLSRAMRRFAQAGTRPELLACARLFELSPTADHSRRLMAGFEEAFKGRSLAAIPEELARAMARHGVASRPLAVRLGDQRARSEALTRIVDDRAKREERMKLVEVLGEVEVPGAVAPLLALAERSSDEALRQAALGALRRYEDPEIGARVVALLPRLSGAAGASAQALLASRGAWAHQFAEAIAAGAIPARTVPLETVEKLRLHRSERLDALLAQIWPAAPEKTSTPLDETVRRTVALLQAGTGDPYRGHEHFQARCAACHTLFGQGGHAGPDLTSFRRDDLQSMALHVVHPNAEIREGYESFTARTRDGRVVSGFRVEEDAKVLVLRGLDGKNVTLDRSEITELQAAGVSLMPSGLLEGLDEQQVRDLFAYLRATQPLVLKRLKPSGQTPAAQR